jgi:succinoglycan biosynthesis protein ExoV
LNGVFHYTIHHWIDSMRVFYYRASKNFGDNLNHWVWPRLIPDQLGMESDDLLVGIGSLIKSDLSKVPGRKIIFGTGSGYGALPLAEEIASWRFYCVRGPLTARLLGLPSEKAVVDGAWLVDMLPDCRYRHRHQSGVVFVPHWTTDLYANWRQPCGQPFAGR